MYQLGNLAIVCAKSAGVLLRIIDGKATVLLEAGPEKQQFTFDWQDDGGIEMFIYELNHGYLQNKCGEDNHDSRN